MLWLVFYAQGKEVCAYTSKETFDGECYNTIMQIAAEKGIEPDEITVRAEKR